MTQTLHTVELTYLEIATILYYIHSVRKSGMLVTI
jgi:hypothetical protein